MLVSLNQMSMYYFGPAQAAGYLLGSVVVNYYVVKWGGKLLEGGDDADAEPEPTGSVE
jgi:hypothetical protein